MFPAYDTLLARYREKLSQIERDILDTRFTDLNLENFVKGERKSLMYAIEEIIKIHNEIYNVKVSKRGIDDDE